MAPISDIVNIGRPVKQDVSHQRISSYFVGPRAENYEFFKDSIIHILEEQRDSRLHYFPDDGVFITPEIQNSSAFKLSKKKIGHALHKAAYLLGKHSIPFWNPRYQGHMTMDLSIPASLGYFMTMLYNPNNVSIEASPLTTVAEIEVGKDLCQMLGYNVDPEVTDQPVAWGHITCDGTIANLESVWAARNAKFYPFSIASAMKENGPLAFLADVFEIDTCQGPRKLFKDLTRWELLNLKVQTILDIPERLYDEYHISPGFLESVMQKYGIQSTGKEKLEKEFDIGPMSLFVSNTRHYSWPKAGAVTGIGSDSVIGVTVDHSARLDLTVLERHLQECLESQRAVYAVVAITGSTEEGSVDPLLGVIELRKKFQDQGLSFLIHADGAWGGYFATMLPHGFKPGDTVSLPSEQGSGAGFVPDAALRAKTQEDLFMMRYADSITVDPHKAAYIPYPAGSLCYRDGRMRYLVTWTSPYLSRGELTSTSIGVFGIEGSKPGASVMSTWFSNACIGLGPEGYGKLLSEVTFTCSRLSAEWAAMSTNDDSFLVRPFNMLPSETANNTSDELVEEERQKIRERILIKTNEEIVREDAERPDDDKALALLQALGSDLNINAFSCNWKYADGTINEEVEEANYFNTRVIQRLSVDSPNDDPTEIPFFLTSTTFLLSQYEDCAQNFKRRLKLLPDNVDLVVLRNVVMSPWPTDGNFIAHLALELRKVLEEEVEVCRQRNDTSSDLHSFLVQGTSAIYLVHFPMFHLAKHRHQLILSADLPPESKKTYAQAKKENPQATFVLNTQNKESLTELVSGKTFQANIQMTSASQSIDPLPTKRKSSTDVVKDVKVTVTSVLKDRSLKARFSDEAYPSGHMPFYLYGANGEANIDHVLVRSPNIHLSADNVKLDLKTELSSDALSKGAILFAHGVQEAAMQPFQSTQGALKDTLNTESKFFFRPGQTFPVTVYKDKKAADATGPGLVNVENLEEITTGSVTIGESVYEDSYYLNKDPFEVPEGEEKYLQWKKVFDKIGQELH